MTIYIKKKIYFKTKHTTRTETKVTKNPENLSSPSSRKRSYFSTECVNIYIVYIIDINMIAF